MEIEGYKSSNESSTSFEPIFVKNLSIRCQENDFREVLKAFVSLEKVNMKHDAKLVGFAFLTFSNENETEQALRFLQGRNLHGRQLK